MTTPHVLDELSPYIDGECRDPERVARHLQSCPDCARRHLELRRLSAHLRAIPAPAVSRDFAERVAARVNAAPADEGRLRPMALRLACAACLLLAIGGGALRWMPHTSPSPAAPAPLSLNTAWQDDDRVVAEFARLMDAGVPLDLFGDPEDLEPDEVGLPMDADAVLDALAYGVADDEQPAEASEDLDIMLDELSELDARTLEDLLQAYENEG